MFPFNSLRQRYREIDRKDLQIEVIQQWCRNRFSAERKVKFGQKINLFVKANILQLVDIDKHFDKLKKVLDKVGSCEYCENYIGESPINRHQGVSVLYGCCKIPPYAAVKYDYVCYEWYPKMFWKQLIYYSIRKYYGPYPYSCNYFVDYGKEAIRDYREERYTLRDDARLNEGY
jgi:hypothetical protein